MEYFPETTAVATCRYFLHQRYTKRLAEYVGEVFTTVSRGSLLETAQRAEKPRELRCHLRIYTMHSGSETRAFSSHVRDRTLKCVLCYFLL